jgi:hypothetical protein
VIVEMPLWLGLIIAALVCGAALWKGGFEERMTGCGFLLSLAVTFVFEDRTWEDRTWEDRTWPHIQKAIFPADTALFVLLVVLALLVQKYWPMAAASVQLLAVLTYVAKMLDTGVGQWAYMTAGVIWTYLLLIALGIGVWNCRRRKRSPSFHHPPAPG